MRRGCQIHVEPGCPSRGLFATAACIVPPQSQSARPGVNLHGLPSSARTGPEGTTRLIRRSCVSTGVLWLAIVATTVMPFDRSEIAGWLMVLCPVQASRASVLNLTMWLLNAG